MFGQVPWTVDRSIAMPLPVKANVTKSTRKYIRQSNRVRTNNRKDGVVHDRTTSDLR
jgi:hypothetical protein